MRRSATARPAARRLVTIWFLLAAFLSLGAQHRTTNFHVHAPTPQIAQQIGQYAEHYRREKAIEWLGREMPNWPQPCPLHVTVNMEGPSGATSFHFGQGTILSMKMEIQGPLDRLLASVLPHEVTHTVFAHHFRQPVPRWADEGGSVLSEDDIERARHDKLTRQILNKGQQIPLRRLFALKEYPREVMCLYAQGYSMSDYLVRRSDRRVFLEFVGHGMRHGWDSAVQSFYSHRSVEELEAAWLQHLRETKNQPPDQQFAQNPRPGAAPRTPASTAAVTPPNRQNQTASRPIIRLTAPPVEPLEPAPIVRGAAPSAEQAGQRFGRPASMPPPPPLPLNLGGSHANQAWQPVTVAPIPAAALPPAALPPAALPPAAIPAAPRFPQGVQLLPPQFDAPGYPR
jgi:hypothetical protein